jgi:MarR family transcriptional regulator, organic hydroperoxide resistance regulator
MEKSAKNIKRIKLIKEIYDLQGMVGHFWGPHSRAAWMDLDLTIGQLKSLLFLSFEGSTNLGRLAEALGVTPPNVTGIVGRLVEQGLVTREEKPENRRMLVVNLTAEGRRLMSRLREGGLEHMNNIINQLSDDDLAALIQGLKAIVKITNPHFQDDNL